MCAVCSVGETHHVCVLCVVWVKHTMCVCAVLCSCDTVCVWGGGGGVYKISLWRLCAVFFLCLFVNIFCYC